ncbi:C-C motif chemokine 4 homolog isoform X2 [Alosa sapidissima]|uniref:C-C motif chemokine 4 homolog isoform X2 n=1 Tax=Alosa sapidissima TaxID=34773 RepID=UPI001C083F26|nr:C-C motif chemokine 4 homolog isoform X2 [Alosa sapidissima]
MKMKMKLSCVTAAAVAVLVLVLCSQGQSKFDTPDKSCFEYYTKRIPLEAIKGYKVTSPICPDKGVFFVTVKDKELCANPEVKEVQYIMYRVKRRPLPNSIISPRSIIP